MKLSWIPRMAAGAPALVGLAASFGQPGFAYAPRIPPIPAPVHDYSLSVEPRSLRLEGPRSVARLLVTLNRTDGATLDISDRVRYAVVGPPVVEVGKDRILRPKRNGSARIKAVY